MQKISRVQHGGFSPNIYYSSVVEFVIHNFLTKRLADLEATKNLEYKKFNFAVMINLYRLPNLVNVFSFVTNVRFRIQFVLKLLYGDEKV